MDYGIQPGHQSLIALAKYTESLSLCSKYVRDGVGTIAGIELGSKRMGI